MQPSIETHTKTTTVWNYLVFITHETTLIVSKLSVVVQLILEVPFIGEVPEYPRLKKMPQLVQELLYTYQAVLLGLVRICPL